MYQEVFQRIPGVQCLVCRFEFCLVPRYVFSKCYREDSRASALRADEAFMMELEKIKVGDICLGLEKLEIALIFLCIYFGCGNGTCVYIYINIFSRFFLYKLYLISIGPRFADSRI